MRRFAYFLLPLFAAGVLLFGVVMLSGGLTAVFAHTFQQTTPITPPPEMVIEGIVASQPEILTLHPADPATIAAFSQVGSAADSCSNATALFEESSNEGGQTIMNSMTEAATDPSLHSCLWANPSRPQGYRTVWYKFTAPRNGTVRISTLDSNFDTILAVYENVGDDIQPCDNIAQNLAQVACSDDANGVTSDVEFIVRRDTEYLVEIADFQSGVSDVSRLNITAILDPVDTLWDVVSTPSNLPGSLSRHAVVSDGSRYIYVIGGQTTLNNTPIVSRRLARFDTTTGSWQEMASLPGAAGLSNTTAVYLQGKIYVPGGYNGNNQLFDGTHWVYDIASNAWSNNVQSIGESTAGWPVGDVPFAWGTAVASRTDQYHLLGGLVSSTHPTGTERILNTFYTYSTTTGQWATQPNMASPRYAHTAGLIGNGKLCVIGGLTGDPNNGLALLSNGECWDGLQWSPIASLNIPRYNAGSAVGADGNWYVFGGLDGSGNEVSVTEMYDANRNQWVEFGVGYDLGATKDLPARAWPRGAFVGQHLWVIGGDYFDFQAQQRLALDLVERLRLFLPGHKQNMPLIVKNWAESDDSFLGARHLPLNQVQHPIFGTEDDFYDTFFFEIGTTRNIAIHLDDVPSLSDYDLYVYDSNKTPWAKSDSPFSGRGEDIVLNSLAPGRYYVVVFRDHPSDGAESKAYRLVVEG